jgi:hypothetical protein
MSEVRTSSLPANLPEVRHSGAPKGVWDGVQLVHPTAVWRRRFTAKSSPGCRQFAAVWEAYIHHCTRSAGQRGSFSPRGAVTVPACTCSAMVCGPLSRHHDGTSMAPPWNDDGTPMERGGRAARARLGSDKGRSRRGIAPIQQDQISSILSRRVATTWANPCRARSSRNWCGVKGGFFKRARISLTAASAFGEESVST